MAMNALGPAHPITWFPVMPSLPQLQLPWQVCPPQDFLVMSRLPSTLCHGARSLTSFTFMLTHVLSTQEGFLWQCYWKCLLTYHLVFFIFLHSVFHCLLFYFLYLFSSYLFHCLECKFCKDMDFVLLFFWGLELCLGPRKIIDRW